jgi:hypothetical protein
MSEEEEIRREERRMRGSTQPVKTWWLYTKDGRHVFTDPNCAMLESGATLEGSQNTRSLEFREAQHPDDDKDALAKKVSAKLGVECVWKRGPDWSQDMGYR